MRVLFIGDIVGRKARNFAQKKTRIEKMKSLIEASSNLSDCLEFLEISNRLRYGNTDKIKEKIHSLDSQLSKNVFFWEITKRPNKCHLHH